MATHSSIFAWRISLTGEPGGLQFTGSQRLRHDCESWRQLQHQQETARCCLFFQQVWMVKDPKIRYKLKYSWLWLVRFIIGKFPSAFLLCNIFSLNLNLWLLRIKVRGKVLMVLFNNCLGSLFLFVFSTEWTPIGGHWPWANFETSYENCFHSI